MNETPWKVFGFEKFLSEKGENCVRLYVARPLSLRDGNTGEGFETHRLFYKPEYVRYEPKCNDLIVAAPGRYPGSIGAIYVVGHDCPRD